MAHRVRLTFPSWEKWPWCFLISFRGAIYGTGRDMLNRCSSEQACFQQPSLFQNSYRVDVPYILPHCSACPLFSVAQMVKRIFCAVVLVGKVRYAVEAEFISGGIRQIGTFGLPFPHEPSLRLTCVDLRSQNRYCHSVAPSTGGTPVLSECPLRTKKWPTEFIAHRSLRFLIRNSLWNMAVAIPSMSNNIVVKLEESPNER